MGAGSVKRAGLPGWLAPNATVFVSSGCIMVVELVAGRQISRYLGQSLYTWTSIIGVVLAGIALGNYLGGRLADRSSGRGTLAAQFLVAAAGCVIVLALNGLVGEWPLLVSLPWPARIFGHVTLTFMLPATLLGTISPVVAKRALNLGLATGRTMGNVYAWAIAGSIVGTFATGFYLLMWMGTTALVSVAAGVLGLMGVSYGIGAFLSRNALSPTRPRHLEGKAGGIAELETVSARDQDRRQPSLRAWLMPVGAVFVASACVMAMEMVAGRVMARAYGQSLYTWTTVIGVVLAGMSLGSHLGGRLADRFRIEQVLCTLFALSSALCLAIPAVNKAFGVWHALDGLSWPVRIALHTTGAFVLPAIVLGAIPPVAARMALMQGHATGRTVGNIYAWGSVGSIVGTFVSGYWLIAVAGMIGAVSIVAGVLALAALPFAPKSKGAWAWGIACTLALASAASPWPGGRNVALMLVLRQLQPPDVVYVDESQYSFIRIMADPEEPTIREMALDNLVHSRVNLADPQDLRYDYEWVYKAVLDAYPVSAGPLKAMVIGGGGYSFPHYLEVTYPGSYIDVSEIDPAVTEAAHAACGLPRDTSVRIFNMDARNHIDDLLRQERAGTLSGSFDYIFGDSINDYSVPYHLTTREFNERLSDLLTDEGLYLLNMIDMLDSGRFLGAVINTCRKTFPHVYVFSVRGDPTTRDTFVVVNSKRPLDLTSLPARLRSQHDFWGRLLTPGQLDALATRHGDIVLRDDFAPVENMLAPVVRASKNDLLRKLLESADGLLAAGNPDKAIGKCRTALRRWPASAEAYEMLGAALRDAGDLDGGIVALRKSIALFPDRASPYQNLSRALFEKGALDEAAAALRTAMAIKPDHAPDYEGLGAILIHKGDFDGACQALWKAIDLDPQSVPAHNNLAVALFNREDIRGAIGELKTVLAIDPNQGGIHRQLAVAYWRVKEYDNAWAEVRAGQEKGESMDPNFLEALKRDSGR